ncbi:endolytic transglycosylase MltG [uncultured Kordia sp.]|uniref:endolytic transglycosylase MltG n=1 Tax=uncultured Kordia sp. TaxID=507699 RepID=UPI002627738B|nr:endolytic transglycosylase MltG [uncultured Kordia sp.]
MSYIKKILVVIAVLGLVFCGIKVYGITQTFSGPNTVFNNEEAYIYIPSKKDEHILKDELFPLLKDEESFKQVASRLGYNQLKAGKYTIKKEMSNLDIVRTLQAKSDVINVVIPNTNEIDVIAKQISNQIEATEMELITVLDDTLFLIDKKLKFPALYKPGAYKMPWNTSATNFRDRMYKNISKTN